MRKNRVDKRGGTVAALLLMVAATRAAGAEPGAGLPAKTTAAANWTAASANGAAGAPIAARAAKLSLRLRADEGFYDDAWAVDPGGTRLAVVRSDGATFQKVEIYALASGAGESPSPNPVVTFDLPPPARAIQSLVFWPDGAGLLLISPAAANSDAHLIESFANSGKAMGKVDSVSAFGLAKGAAAQGKSATPVDVLVVVERRPGGNGQLGQVVTPLRVPELKPAGKARRYDLAADGTLRPQGLLTIGFFDGYSKLLVQRPGAFDKKKDVRQPDAQAVLDLLSGKLSADQPIQDVYGWARTTRLRREHPNRTAFIQLANTLSAPGDSVPAAQSSGIELVTPTGGLAPVALAVPFRLYDRLTLKDQEGPPPGTLHFGLQIDPVNPDAVARKKADQPFLDLYTVSLDHPREGRLRARIPLDAQPVVWLVPGGGGQVVVFRRFKNFARGGDRIDVYDLGP